jgi:hypothetical protein
LLADGGQSSYGLSAKDQQRLRLTADS